MRYAALLLLVPSLAFAHYPNVRVIDGDNVYVPNHMVENMPMGISVRLIGINTPEIRAAKCDKERLMGEAAQLFIRDAIDRSTAFSVKYVKWDKYGGRIDGIITVDGKDLSQLLIDAGLAVPYTRGIRVNVWC